MGLFGRANKVEPEGGGSDGLTSISQLEMKSTKLPSMLSFNQHGKRTKGTGNLGDAAVQAASKKGKNTTVKKSKPSNKDSTAQAIKKVTTKRRDGARLKAPKLRQFNQYRDKASVGFFALVLLFMLIIVVYSQLTPTPEQYLCTREQCTCTSVDNTDAANPQCPEIGTFGPYSLAIQGVSYYYIKPEKNAGNPLCYAVPDPEVSEEVLIVDYQPIYEDFNALEDCVVEESLYHVLMTSRAFFWYCYVVGLMLILNTVFFLGFQMFPSMSIWVTNGLVALALWVTFITSCVLLSGWAFIWFFLAFMHMIYFLLIKAKIPDLNMLLMVTASLASMHKGIVLANFVAAVAQAALFVSWGYIWVTINARLTWVVDLLWFLSFIWMTQIVKYTAFTVSAGSVASWYFARKAKFPTLRAVVRALSTSVGSIIYGSLLMSLFKVIRILTSFLRVSTSFLAVLCAGCLICFEAFMKHFNIYGFVFVAVYGFDFNKSSTKAYTLITEHSLRGMMLDDILEASTVIGGFGMGAIAVGACWVGLQLGLAPGYEDYNFGTTLFIPSFILGLLMGMLVMDITEAVVCTIYTCFAEEPRVLETTDRNLYTELKEQWYDGLAEFDEEEEGDVDEDGEDRFSISTGVSDNEDDLGDFEESAPAVATMVSTTRNPPPKPKQKQQQQKDLDKAMVLVEEGRNSRKRDDTSGDDSDS